MARNLSKQSEDPEFEEWRKKFIRISSPWVESVSYYVFKTHIRPILGADVTESKFIYHDPEISPQTQASLRRADTYGLLFVGVCTIAMPLLLARYVVAYMRTRSVKPNGLNFLDKHVLAWAAGMFIPLFPVSKYVGEQIPVLRLDAALCGDSENEQLRVYRKRFFDARPDLMGMLYIESRMREYDGVKDPREKKPEKKLDD